MTPSDIPSYSQCHRKGKVKEYLTMCKSISTARKVYLSTRLSIRSLVSFSKGYGALYVPSKFIPGCDNASFGIGNGNSPRTNNCTSAVSSHPNIFWKLA